MASVGSTPQAGLNSEPHEQDYPLPAWVIETSTLQLPVPRYSRTMCNSSCSPAGARPATTVEKHRRGMYLKAIVLCEGSDVDRLSWGDVASPASDIGEVMLRSPEVGVDSLDIDLRRGLSAVVSIFSQVIIANFVGSTSDGLRGHGRRRVLSFLHLHTRQAVVDRLAVGPSRQPIRRLLRIRRCNVGSTRSCSIYQAFPQGEPS
jgi:hypothetical protein